MPDSVRNTLSSLFGPIMAAGLTLGASNGVAAYLKQDAVLESETWSRTRHYISSGSWQHQTMCSRLDNQKFKKIQSALQDFNKDAGADYGINIKASGKYGLTGVSWPPPILDTQIAERHKNVSKELYYAILNVGYSALCPMEISSDAYAVFNRMVSSYEEKVQALQEREDSPGSQIPAETHNPPTYDPDTIVQDAVVS